MSNLCTVYLAERVVMVTIQPNSLLRLLAKFWAS